MGNIAKGRRKVGVVIDDDIGEAIEARAAALGIKPARFASLIFERWRDQGFPAVSDADRALVLLKGKSKKTANG